MGRPRGWAAQQTGRAMSSPGRPGVNQLETKQAFWNCIAEAMESDAAALACGVSQPFGPRWFRQTGGMPPIDLARARVAIYRSRSVRSLPCFGRRTAALRDRTAAWSFALDHLTRTARQCGHPRRYADLSGDGRAVESRASGKAAQRPASSPRTSDYGLMCRTDWRMRLPMRRAGRYRDPTYRGREDGMVAGPTGVGALAGVRSRSAAGCDLISPMMSLCRSHTKPSIKHSTFRAVVHCDANSLCVSAYRPGTARATGQNAAARKKLHHLRGADQ